MSESEEREAIYSLFDAEGDRTYFEFSNLLKKVGSSISEQDYDIWKRFFYPIAKSNPCLYSGIVLEGKGLAWVAESLYKARSKGGLS